MNHTPGPWTQNIKNGRVVMSGEVKVATADKSAGGGSTAWDNARLIAAAPELLEACKHVIDCGMECPGCTTMLRAAIAKAEGRTQ